MTTRTEPFWYHRSPPPLLVIVLITSILWSAERHHVRPRMTDSVNSAAGIRARGFVTGHTTAESLTPHTPAEAFAKSSRQVEASPSQFAGKAANRRIIVSIPEKMVYL